MEKIKQFLESEKGKDILVIIVIILVGLGSFELGRLSKDSVNPGIKIEYPGQEANVLGSTENLSDNDNMQKSNPKNFFASSKGSKYYSISCGAGKTIKEENRIYFTTSTEAQNAGYVLSGSCK